MFPKILQKVATFLVAISLSYCLVEAQKSRSLEFPQQNPPSISRIVTDIKETPFKSGEMLMAPTTQYSHGDPTALEQQNLEFINQARANPVEEGIRLANTTDQAVQNAYTFFNIDKTLFQSQFANYPAKGPLAFNALLIQSARGHSVDMRDNQFQDHSGSNGSTVQQRINLAGYTGWSGIGENVFSYAQSIWHAHAGFNVDWGADNQVTLGHRKNIMNFEGAQYREVGIGIYSVQQPSQVGPLVVTQNFGLKGTTKFVTGVVYKDLNNNNFYDPGEGLVGVKVMPANGTFYAITSTSGGYAIPFTSSGSMTITASGGEVPIPIVRNAQLSIDNVKVDFILGQGNFTPNVVLNLPSNNSDEAEAAITFQWYPGQGATQYQFEISESVTFTTLLGQPFVTTDTSRTVTGLVNGKTYYWRVRANGPTGWSQYSTVYSVRRYSIPEKVVMVYPMDKEVLSQNSVLLTWVKNKVPTTKYWVEVSTDEYMDEPIISDSTKNDTTRLADNLQPGTYYWWVSAKNEIDWTYAGFDDIQTFVINAPGTPTTLVTPPSEFVSQNGKIPLSWTPLPTNSTPVSYKVFVANNIEFTDPYTVTLSSAQYQYENQTNGTYYWKVENNANGAMGSVSETRMFTISIPTSVGNTIDGIQIGDVVPNPATSSSSIQMNNSVPFTGTIQILDVQGNIKGVLDASSFGTGTQTILIPTNNLSSGVYFVRIQHPNGMIMKKFIVTN